MSDYRQNLIKSIEESIITVVDREAAELITGKIIRILNDYEVTKRCTEIVPYDDQNDRIIKRYCACLMVDGKSQKTIDQYRRAVRKAADFIGAPLPEIGVYDLRYYLACEKERGVSNRTLENTRANLSAFFQWMTQEELIAKNPCMNIKPIKYVEEIRKPFSEVEIDLLRSACSSLKERALVEILLASGIRVSELTGMDVSDIDFAKMKIHVRNGKGAKERYTYLNDVAASHLKKYLFARSGESEALFTNKNGGRINPGGVRYILKQLEARAKITDVHPHRFRRTFATGLANRGMNIQEIQKLLGHSNINTTLEYVCTSDEKIKASYRQYIA